MSLLTDLMKTAKEKVNTEGSSSSSSNMSQDESDYRAMIDAEKKDIKKKYTELGEAYYNLLEGNGNEETCSEIVEHIKKLFNSVKIYEEKIKDSQKEALKAEIEQAKKKAEESFEEEKAKIDKALELEVITQEEYSIKLEVLQKKLDNAEEIAKIKQKRSLGIISEEEMKEKLSKF